MSKPNVFEERRKELFEQDRNTASKIAEIRRTLQNRQLPYGNLILESYRRTEAIKHLEIAEMYLLRPAES